MSRQQHNHRGGRALTRRQFIAAALSLTAGGLSMSLAEATAARGSESNAPLSASADMLEVLSDPAASARFGRAYLAEHPAEADVKVLIEQLSAAVGSRRGTVPTDPDALTAALVAVIEHEYATLPPRRIGGWLLAPSEARLYALAALAGAPSGV
jgi:hypothetical protein